MINPTAIKTLLARNANLEQEVRVQGWVQSCRHSKGGFSFIALSDGSCFNSMQTIIPNNVANYDSVIHLSTGAAVDIIGILTASSGKGQQVEIQGSHISIIGDIEDPANYPIAKKRHTFEHLRTVAHLRTRTNTFGAVTRLRNTVASSIHSYFQKQGFQWVNTPVITTSDCEGAGELFKVSTLDLLNLPTTTEGEVDYSQDFFACPAYLTVSGQLQAEAYCLAFSKVYTFGPTFRAEHSNTSRHLAEFWMIEPEIAFAGLAENMALAEDFLKAIGTAVLTDRADDMAFFADRIDSKAILRLEQLVKADFEQIEYSEAINILQACKRQFEFPVTWGVDLQSEHERYLTEEHVGRPVILTNYPKAIKPFYMRQNEDGKTVAAMDVLVPGMGEIIGGGQREERPEVLSAALQERGLQDQLSWYLDLRRYGSAPHAGFGLGLERLLGYISGMSNVRDLIPFARVPGHAGF